MKSIWASAIVILFWIIIAGLKIHSDQDNFPGEKSIAGNYFRHWTPGIDGDSKYYLSLKENSEYKELLVVQDVHGGFKVVSHGKWKLKGDTIIILPEKIVQKGKRFKGEHILHCAQQDSNVFCGTDTLLYKGNGLWDAKPTPYEVYKRIE